MDWRNNPRLRALRASTAIEALRAVEPPPTFRGNTFPAAFLPVMVSGGVGDLVVALGVLERVKAVVGPVRVWSNYPDVHRYFGGAADIGRGAFPGFSYWLKIQQAPVIYSNRGARTRLNPRHAKLFEDWVRRLNEDPDIARLAHYQPHMDNELALAATARGLNRRSLPHWLLGFPTAGCEPELSRRRTPIDLEPFITVHDGFDVTQTDVPYRSTKSWNLRHWRAFVLGFKSENPDVLVVQLGGPTSRPIPGVDVNFSGKLRIEQSLDVLARSSLHVDGDSGLVHAAHAMGVRSVVVFGPTPADFFGYPDNVNLEPKVCGGCWWLSRTWMRQCPLYDRPECVDSAGPVDVLEAVRVALTDR